MLWYRESFRPVAVGLREPLGNAACRSGKPRSIPWSIGPGRGRKQQLPGWAAGHRPTRSPTLRSALSSELPGKSESLYCNLRHSSSHCSWSFPGLSLEAESPGPNVGRQNCPLPSTDFRSLLLHARGRDMLPPLWIKASGFFSENNQN